VPTDYGRVCGGTGAAWTGSVTTLVNCAPPPRVPGETSTGCRWAGVVLCLIAEDRATLTEMMNSRVTRFYTLLLGADRGAQWRERGYRHPLGDDWGYARCAAPGRATAAELNAAVDQVPA
jgi:hypothetical protein